MFFFLIELNASRRQKRILRKEKSVYFTPGSFSMVFLADTDRHTDRQTTRQIQTDRKTHTHTHTHTLSVHPTVIENGSL